MTTITARCASRPVSRLTNCSSINRSPEMLIDWLDSTAALVIQCCQNRVTAGSTVVACSTPQAASVHADLEGSPFDGSFYGYFLTGGTTLSPSSNLLHASKTPMLVYWLQKCGWFEGVEGSSTIVGIVVV